jgi:hypothetical protein
MTIGWQYADLLKECTGIDICSKEGVESKPADKPPEPVVYKCCGKYAFEVADINKDGMLTCWECGKVLEMKLYVLQEDEYGDDGKPLGSKSQYGPIPKKRVYKRITHFREHVRRYVGARFTNIPEDVIEAIRDNTSVDVQSPTCYNDVKKALKQLKEPKLYKEIFTIIYELGGTAPKIDHIIQNLYDNYAAFDYYYEQIRKDTGRKNGISYYMVLDMMLKEMGYTPYYELPYLKDEELRQKVLDIFLRIRQEQNVDATRFT